MNDANFKTLKDGEMLMEKLGVPLNSLKRKYLRGLSYNTHKARARTTTKGQNGRAKNRVPGWKKHGKGPANVSR